MEKTRNSVIDLFKDLFKNFGLVISKLVNDGVVDDAQLTGELAKDPMKALEEYEASLNVKSSGEQTRTQTRVRTQARENSAAKRPTKNTVAKEVEKSKDNDELEM